MELSSLSKSIIPVPFERGGESTTLQVDIDAISPAFFRTIGEKFKKKFKGIQGAENTKNNEEDALPPVLQFFEIEADAMEFAHEIRVELLTSGVLVGWDVNDNGKPVKPTKKLLLSRPPAMVKELWETCLNAAQTVKKNPATKTETEPVTHDGSMALRVVGQNT